MAHLLLQHTSASLTLNENCDPSVRSGMEAHLHLLAPEDAPYYRHTCEGPDDMAAHIKSSLLGVSLQLPISDSHLALGTWQGIWLGEHRVDGAKPSLCRFYGLASYPLAIGTALCVAQPTLKGVSSANGAASIKACGS